MQFSEPNGKVQRLPDNGRPDTVWRTVTKGSAYDHLVMRVCRFCHGVRQISIFGALITNLR